MSLNGMSRANDARNRVMISGDSVVEREHHTSPETERRTESPEAKVCWRARAD